MKTHWMVVAEHWLRVAEMYAEAREAVANFPCVYCGKTAETVDHVVPRYQGGRDDLMNLLPVCRSCNRSKSALLLDEWADRQKARLDDLAQTRARRALMVKTKLTSVGLEVAAWMETATFQRLRPLCGSDALALVLTVGAYRLANCPDDAEPDSIAELLGVDITATLDALDRFTLRRLLNICERGGR